MMMFIKRTEKYKYFLILNDEFNHLILKQYGYVTNNYFRDRFLSILCLITVILFGFMIGFIFGIDHGFFITLVLQSIIIYYNIKLWLFVDRLFKKLSIDIWLDDFNKLTSDEKLQLVKRLKLPMEILPMIRNRKSIHVYQNKKK